MENPPPVQPKTPPATPSTPPQPPTVQPQSPTEAPPVVKPDDKPKSKLFPLLVFLLLAALGVVGCFGWQNYQSQLSKEVVDVQPESSPVVGADQTSDWETYENDLIEINYPWPWARIETQSIIPLNNNTSAVLIGPGDNTLGEIRIWGYNKPNTSLDEAFAMLSQNSIIKMEKRVKINGYSAIKHILTNQILDGKWGNLGIIIANPSGSGAYAIFSNVEYSVDENGEIVIPDDVNKLFEQITSTFKFVDEGDETEEWKTHIDAEHNFSIKYPEDWRTVESSSMFGTGPKHIPEDILWGVWNYNKSERDIEKIISEIGSQFADRKEQRIELLLDGLSVIKVIVTTTKYSDWYSESILFEKDNRVYFISNGAIKDDKFVEFYKSFQFTD